MLSDAELLGLAARRELGPVRAGPVLALSLGFGPAAAVLEPE